MADTGGTRRERRAAARAERQAAEKAAAAKARQRTRLFQLGGALALAVAVVVVILIATSGGDDGPTKKAGESVAGATDTAALLAGISQRGAELGDPRAPVTMIEFGDLQCPYCKDASDQILPSVIENYVRDGRVKLIFRDVAFLGDDSIRAAQMAGAAGLQNKLWDYVHLFYLNQGTENTGYVTDDFLREIGSGVRGLNVDRAFAERADPQVDRALQDAREEWTGYGFQGTPSFVVGPTGGTLEPVSTDNGLNYEALKGPIDRAIAAAQER
ncbi:thioredoxin domain-containing protein [Conexibacter sp. JD483]|uniref:DsbA family protein n=1 Tax=unclassified Conexibacter TaxID=2627773 RepID=UPI0027209EFC|nr:MULTISPECIES: thioredoxin domain-containing protein [unclassified Conexibacter]MDO8189182.1 thioredoxin domain-containing protein [Conexibacter sp. CPCC 205706]MDO8201915.1 thioredoxin domain-containing protein [Conexibacter sp. CPCC 205762]MDR9371954.1 thioredoxin domain-containing protein [Conexibacter sp. JD483]